MTTPLPAHPAGHVAVEGEIFRTIEVGPDLPVTLGEPLSAAVRALGTLATPREFRMRDGTFGGGASAITMLLHAGGAVGSIDFAYLPGIEYAASVTHYTGMLGPPQRETGSPAGERQTARWDDGATAFELLRQGNDVSSILSDLRGDG